MFQNSAHKLSDQELISELKDSNSEALDEIFNRYWERLFQSAKRLLIDKEVAKDVVQEVMISLWERRQELLIHNLNAFLIQAVKYQVAYHLRKGRFTEKHQEHLDNVCFVNTTEEALNFNELKTQVLHSLDVMPNKCRQIFYMSRFEYLSNQEIADNLGISIRTVETQISNALKLLRSELPIYISSMALFVFPQIIS